MGGTEFSMLARRPGDPNSITVTIKPLNINRYTLTLVVDRFPSVNISLVDIFYEYRNIGGLKEFFVFIFKLLVILLMAIHKMVLCVSRHEKNIGRP